MPQPLFVGTSYWTKTQNGQVNYTTYPCALPKNIGSALCLITRLHAHRLPVFSSTVVELNQALLQCVQRVVRALHQQCSVRSLMDCRSKGASHAFLKTKRLGPHHAYMLARVETRAALLDNDVARAAALAAVKLYAQMLWQRLTTQVSRRASSLLGCAACAAAT